MGSARARSRALGLCALLSLGACSLINHFDDVKPETTGGASGSTGLGGASSTGSSTTTTGGSGGTATGSGGDTVTTSGSGGTAVTGTGGSTTSGPGGAAGTVGGSSSTGGNAGMGGSGVTDAGPPRVLQCRFLIGSATGGHRKLDDFSSLPANMDRTLADKFFMLPTGNGTSVRIMAQLRGPQIGYIQYFASDGGGSPMGFPTPAGGRLLDASKIDINASAALVVSQGMPGQPQQPPQLMLHRFDDASQNPMPAVIPLTNQGDLGTSGSIEARMSAAADGTIAVAMSFQPTTGLYRAAFGLYAGAPVRVVSLFDDPNSDSARPSGLQRVRPSSTNYAFYGEQGPQTSQIEYEIRDGARLVSDTTHRTIPRSAYVLMTELSLGGKVNVVAADLDIPMMRWFKLLVGQVDITQSFSFDAASLVVAKTATSLIEVPVGSLSGLTGDMLLFAGPTGIARKELSLWFVDVYGQTRVEQKLADTQGEISNAIAFPRGNIGSVNNKYHLAWSETLLDGMGAKYDVIWYDQIECL